ncbi:MAG: DUF4365 domain-containing protein [Chloroflexota bacterium]
MARKRRTRQHIIADLSINHVDRFILLAGYTAEKREYDYGIDLNLYTYSKTGDVENASIYIQVKSSENPRYLKDGQHVSFTISKKDLDSWIEEPLPIILVLYDVPQDKAYWVYIQRYFESLPDFDLASVGNTVTMRLKISQVVDVASVKEWAAYKQNILSQVKGTVQHE